MNILFIIISFISGAVLASVSIYLYRKLSNDHDQQSTEHGQDSFLSEIPHEDPEQDLLKTGHANQDVKNNLILVNELSQKITSSLSLKESFNQMYHTINSMMDAAVIELQVKYGPESHHSVFSNLNNNDGSQGHTNHMADWSFRNNREIFLPDAAEDYERYVYKPLTLTDGRTARSLMSFPVHDNKQVIGILTVISFTKGIFEEFHREMIRYLLPFIAVAIKNAHHHRELSLLKQRAERSEKFMQQFLANMSHEVRTPINAVTGMTRLLIDKGPKEDQMKYLESIRNASETLLVIINDILDLSKIEAKKLEIEHIDFSVRDVVRNTDDIMRFKANSKGLQFTVRIDDEIASSVKGDPVRLTQILINLIGNAIKFTEKGKVSLEVKLDHPESFTSAQVNRIRFIISDTGIGMNEEQQKILFRDYAQASTEITRKYGGTGLGLSISSQLVKLQGGEIGVNSREGEGSTFWFILEYPLSVSNASVKEEPGIMEEIIKNLHGIKVLITDDNEYNRIVVTESMGMKIPDVTIDEAKNGTEALELIERKDYDIVLMDLVMLNMDGFEVTRRIREDLSPPKCNIPVIALTASAAMNEHERCIEAGMNGFISKPFKTSELLNVIHNVLKGSLPDDNGSEIRKPANTKLINVSHLHEYMEGDPVRMKRQLDLFAEKVPVMLDKIKATISLGDHEGVRIAAHNIKPLLRVTGMQDAVELANEIETICLEQGDTEKLKHLSMKLSDTCNSALSEIGFIRI